MPSVGAQLTASLLRKVRAADGEQSDENMPHFTVVPVKDQDQSNYDSLEGINWVDYRDTGQDSFDHQDTVSSDGKFYTVSVFSGRQKMRSVLWLKKWVPQ